MHHRKKEHEGQFLIAIMPTVEGSVLRRRLREEGVHTPLAQLSMYSDRTAYNGTTGLTVRESDHQHRLVGLHQTS